MREESLKNIIKTLLFPLVFQMWGCVGDMQRPSRLSDSRHPIQYSYQRQTLPQYSSTTGTTNYTPQVAPPTTTRTEPMPSTQREEDVILEEVVYIPSALQSTPVDEIEVVSDSPIKPEPAVIEEEETITTSTTQAKTNEPQKPQPVKGKAPTLKPKKVRVYKGDTLYSIAKANNIKVYDLAEYNKLKAPFTLKLGQTIEIPTDTTPHNDTKQTPPEIMENMDDEKTFIEEPKKSVVIVKKGDTIYSIAKQNNVPLKDVILRNNLKAPYTLSIGDKIFIPNSAFHIVKASDTAYSISRKYNVNLKSLVKLNKLSAPYTLAIGQKILLPATNIDTPKKQIEYVVKDKKSAKVIETTSTPKLQKPKEITQVKIAKKEKITTTPQVAKVRETPEQKQKIERVILKPAPLSSRRFMWPVNGKIISEYGIKNNGKRNDGLNISAKIGTAVFAAENGIVAYAGNELKGLGNLIIIKHDKDYMTIYAHNDSISVSKGTTVKRGQKIATVGKTGRVSTPQLHFEIRKKTKSIDPKDLLESR